MSEGLDDPGIVENSDHVETEKRPVRGIMIGIAMPPSPPPLSVDEVRARMAERAKFATEILPNLPSLSESREAYAAEEELAAGERQEQQKGQVRPLKQGILARIVRRLYGIK